MHDDTVHEEETSELEAPEGSDDMIWRRLSDVPSTGIESALSSFAVVIKDVMEAEISRVQDRLQ